jgi:hypothetical protein
MPHKPQEQLLELIGQAKKNIENPVILQPMLILLRLKFRIFSFTR